MPETTTEQADEESREPVDTPTDAAPTTSIEVPETDVRGALLGIGFVAAVVYFAVFFGRLPPGAWRWIVTVGLAVGVVVLIVAAPYMPRLKQWLNIKLPRWGVVAGDLSMFILVVVAIIFAAVWLKQDDQVVLLKLFAVLYFSLLPAFLFLQFNSGRR